MARVRLAEEDIGEEDGGSYFADQKSPLTFIDAGAAVLNCTLGGGWPLTRFSNVVGDESTGKTLLAIEAMANFHRQFPKGKMFYREAESAFDEEYARALGMPVDHIEFIDPDKFETISDFHDDLVECVNICRRKDVPGFYAVDSLDGLCSKEEKAAKSFDQATFGMGKAKDLHKLCRKLKSEVAKAMMHLMVISQTKFKIDAVAFGEKKIRSGGKALDFFCSQALWLSHKGNDTKEIGGVKRVVGIQVRARCKKNKIALPYRTCDFSIRFGQGIDSLESSINWLKEIKRLDEVIDDSSITKYKNRIEDMNDAEYWEETQRVDKEVVRIWRSIENDFLSNTRRKHG